MRSLSLKFILAFLAVGLTGTALLGLFAGFSTRDRFNDFLFDQNREGFVAQLADFYEQRGSWVGVNEVFPFAGHRGPMGPKWAQEGGPFTLVEFGPNIEANSGRGLDVPRTSVGLCQKRADSRGRRVGSSLADCS